MATEAAKPEESKADRFKRLAMSRTNKALEAIASLEGLANKGNYEYSDEHVEKIVKALEGGVVKLANKFSNPTATTDDGFTL